MKKLSVFFGILFCYTSCTTKEEEGYTPVPYVLEIPALFQEKLIAPIIPSNNPLTVAGVALGKKLFFETLLSGDNTQSCASCHNPSQSFAENQPFSEGIDGIFGPRNAMPLFNLAWNFNEQLMWDGRELSIERQAIQPVINPIEMHSNWDEVLVKLAATTAYPSLFEHAFGDTSITQERVTKAIAQFERTLVSGNSKFDRHLLGTATLTTQELNGFNIFMDETKGDCFHCHGSNNNPLWTDNGFHNNGLDAVATDLGLGAISGDPADNAKFKTPSLRNLTFTAPYMHDGRFTTLEAVVNHYSEGLQNSPTIDSLMKKVAQGGVQLTPQEKADLVAFLRTLSDPDFTNNPAFQNR